MDILRLQVGKIFLRPRKIQSQPAGMGSKHILLDFLKLFVTMRVGQKREANIPYTVWPYPLINGVTTPIDVGK